MMRARPIDWLQLLRLPNVFTAAADVAMGYLVTHGNLQPWWHFALLAASSCSLYLSGMVFNDVFDADVDAREQPHRPVPSGRINKHAAAACGLALLTAGLLAATIASFITHDWRPATVAALLAVCILLYDRVLKPTPLGTLAMGACRSLNVLLGMSLAPHVGSDTTVVTDFVQWGSTAAWLIALGIGLYIVGVTWFARTDSHTSSRGQLIAALAVMIAGLALLFTLPVWTDHNPPLAVSINGWHLLWAALAIIILRLAILAIMDPTPARVQAAVRHSVQALIAVDAVLCVGYVSGFWGTVVLLLLVPTLLLTSWLKAT